MLPAENALTDHARFLMECVQPDRGDLKPLMAVGCVIAYGCPICRACVRVTGLVTVAVKVRCSSCGWSAAAWRGTEETPPGKP